MSPPPEVRVGPRGAARVRSGHPWIFRDDLVDAGDAVHGDLVRAVSGAGRTLGHAFYSSCSKIALRLVDSDERAPGPDLWRGRIARALEHRERVVRDTDAYRIIYGESDGIPGLVADRYGAHLVVQALTAGAERLLDAWLDLLEEKMEVDSVLARNDPAARSLEGMPREVRQLRGRTPEQLTVTEGPVRYRVSPWAGQKTGAFLDQRENRVAAAAYARGRVLDLFGYQGAFGLQAASRGAEVEVVDSSREALDRGRDSAEINGLQMTFTEANVFDDLRARQRRGETFDTIFLDPPAFAKRRPDLKAARRGYKEINLRALRLLAPGGTLVTSSCSYNLAELEWIDVVASAAADSRRTLLVVEKRTQARDHPVRLGFPESHYLKCLVTIAS